MLAGEQQEAGVVLALLITNTGGRSMAETVRWRTGSMGPAAVERLGEHRAAAWITEAPVRVRNRVLRLVSNRVEAADANP